ncbi:MAG: DUF4249 domain-containing protein [Bacteroidales bacterium]|nr:DUF4249 domain-containing protein [Bacteroidales bacterium]
MKRILSYVALIFLCACSEDFVLEYEPELVVEGWIESDGYPVVIVTSTVPIEDKYIPLDSLQNHLIRWAKVSVSDGEQEVVLTGRMNNDYFPPYIYTTSRLKGQAGKKYKLKVEYSGRVVTAETTIPAPVPLEWIKVRSSEDGDRYLTAGLKDDPEEKNYYKFFTKVVGKDSSYVSSFMGLIDDEMLSDDINEVIIRGEFEPDFGKSESSVYYSEGDMVLVRFCTLDKAAFDYWEDHEDIISLSLNPFFPVNKKMRSNISTGYGYWAGYGSTYYRVSVVDSLYLGNK